MDSERHQHDCARCRFLGRVRINFRDVDWYHCPGIMGGSVIGRYGSAGPDYWSAPVDAVARMDSDYAVHARAMLRKAE
jgi:hypothetical protein